MNRQTFSNLKLAFFDIDGTLIRRIPDGKMGLKSQSFNYAINKTFGVNINYMEILGKKIFGLTDRSIVRQTLKAAGIDDRAYHEKQKELFDNINSYFDERAPLTLNREYYVIAGVENLLNDLRSDGIRLGLVTGNIKRHADWKVNAVGLEKFFDTGAFGDDAEARADILKIAINRNDNIDRKSICHFGDSPADLEAARANNIKGVAISDAGGGTHTRDELQMAEYGLIVDSWNDLPTIQEYLGDGDLE